MLNSAPAWSVMVIPILLQHVQPQPSFRTRVYLMEWGEAYLKVHRIPKETLAATAANKDKQHLK
jgi:hypothetical protein